MMEITSWTSALFVWLTILMSWKSEMVVFQKMPAELIISLSALLIHISPYVKYWYDVRFFYNSSYFSLFLTAFELWYLFSSLHTKNQMFLIMLTILMLTCNLFYSKIEFSVIDSDIVSVLFFCHKSLVQRTIYLYYKWQVNVHLFLLPWAST